LTTQLNRGMVSKVLFGRMTLLCWPVWISHPLLGRHRYPVHQEWIRSGDLCAQSVPKWSSSWFGIAEQLWCFIPDDITKNLTKSLSQQWQLTINNWTKKHHQATLTSMIWLRYKRDINGDRSMIWLRYKRDINGDRSMIWLRYKRDINGDRSMIWLWYQYDTTYDTDTIWLWYKYDSPLLCKYNVTTISVWYNYDISTIWLSTRRLAVTGMKLIKYIHNYRTM